MQIYLTFLFVHRSFHKKNEDPDSNITDIKKIGN